MEECNQKKCQYHVTHGFAQFCPVCDECGATSNMISNTCVNCWNCLKDVDYIRKGSSELISITQPVKHKNKKVKKKCQEIIIDASKSEN